MSKRLHSVFFIIFPEIACNFGEKSIPKVQEKAK